MIYVCDCGTLWTRFPTPRAVQVLRVPKRTCPDCKTDNDRQPRSRKRRKR